MAKMSMPTRQEIIMRHKKRYETTEKVPSPLTMSAMKHFLAENCGLKELQVFAEFLRRGYAIMKHWNYCGAKYNCRRSFKN